MWLIHLDANGKRVGFVLARLLEHFKLQLGSSNDNSATVDEGAAVTVADAASRPVALPKQVITAPQANDSSKSEAPKRKLNQLCDTNEKEAIWESSNSGDPATIAPPTDYSMKRPKREVLPFRRAIIHVLSFSRQFSLPPD
jgi:hypothetical protein